MNPGAAPSASDRARSAAVVGAGIGGLAAGIALARGGWEVTVFEATPELRPLGAGLSIWPNGVRALRALGVGAIADEAPRGGGALRRADGTPLASLEPATIEARYGAPLVGLHRADLHEALLGGLGRERLRLGARLEALEDDGTLRFADGSANRPELVVGADGLGSTVRTALLGDGEPRDSGIVAFRGVADPGHEVPAGEFWGPGVIAGLLPLTAGRVYWYVALRAEGEPARLGAPTAHLDPFAPVVAGTAAEDVLVHRLYDRAPARGWSRGNVTLLGDAAHPMLPFLGQGACSALEDAVALGDALAATADVPAALATYEEARAKRTAALVSGSRRAAKAVLARSALGRRLRDALVSHLPEGARLRQLDAFLKPPA